jgi:arylsulfatase A-like enzyme
VTVALFVVVSSRTGTASDSVARPNIVVILADDLGIGDPTCYNRESKISTPHIDRVAREGMRFSDVHSASSVCSPTRYAILTGRYAWRTRMKVGVLQGYSRALIEPGRPTIASLLRDAGYATAGFGKWHLGFQKFHPGQSELKQPVDYAQSLRPGPATIGFDEFFGIPASLDMPPYVFVENDHPVEMPTATIGDSGDTKHARGPFWRGGAIAPSFRHADVLPRITERAVAFLDRQAKSESHKPFFLYFALSAPHTPYLPGQNFRGKSGAGDYGDFVTMVDASVGEVLAALDRNRLTDQTLVILSSDNGARWTPEEIRQFGHRANLNNRGQKSDIYEGGHRIPFIVRWPGKVRAGSTSDEPGCLVDLMATCAAAAGVPLPANAAEDSFNLLPAFRGKQSQGPIRDALVHHSGSGMFAIRAGDWKLVLGLGSGGFTRPAWIVAKPGQAAGQLYNLAKDREETRDVYSQHPEIVRSLTERLERIQRAGGSRPGRSSKDSVSLRPLAR